MNHRTDFVKDFVKTHGFGIRDWGVISRILEIVHLPHFVKILVLYPAFCIQYSGDGGEGLGSGQG
jgi:hypothetical protein